VRRFLILMGVLVVSGCASPVMQETEPYVEEMTLEPEVFPIEEELTYIEMLVGMQELQPARQALDNLLFSITDEFEDELTRARINDMIVILEELETEEQVGATPLFTGAAAVAIAMERFGTGDDISYFYHENPSFFGPSYEADVQGDFTRMGFYVAIKSNAMLEAGSDDAILRLLFVADDGVITELD